MRLQSCLAERKKYGAILRHLIHDRTLKLSVILHAGRYPARMLNRQAQYHSFGCSSGGHPMHSVVILLSIVLAKYGYSTSPTDLQG
jgi:hypothetical protein